MRTFLLFFFFAASCVTVSGQTVLKDITYDQVNRMTMTYADTLKTDIYFAPKRPGNLRSPLLVLVHGGGFYTGKRDGDLEVQFAMDMASRGYVVASIDYDLTRKGKKEGFGCNCPASDKIATFRRAVQNIDAALEFLVKFSKEFGFDAQQIVLAGSSAGAEAVLHAAYAGEHPEFNRLMQNDRKIAGVVSLAGALLNDIALTKDTGVPAFLVHGTDDQLVPYDVSPHHFCGEGAPGYLMLQGSSAIAEALETTGVDFALYTVQGGGHEWANKGYDLTEEISLFLFKLLEEGSAGQVRVDLP